MAGSMWLINKVQPNGLRLYQESRMKSNAFYVSLLAMLLVASSCSLFKKSSDDDLLAIAYDKYLYRSELEGLTPEGMPRNDSLEITKQYIDNWVRQQTLLHHAEGNLEAKQKDFNKQLEAYRNSLIIYAYESELIRQKLDTAVGDAEIREFYESTPSNFLLHENIVKISYLKIPVKDKAGPAAKKARQLLGSKNPDDQIDLLKLCDKSMITCRLDDGNWIPFNELIKEFSLNVSDQEGFLANRTFVETSDSLFVYLIKFVEFKTRENTAPVEMVKDKIKNLILNRRKSLLLDSMQTEIFEEALKNKRIEIL